MISDGEGEVVVSDTDFEQYDMTKIGSGRLTPKYDKKTGKKKKKWKYIFLYILKCFKSI